MSIKDLIDEKVEEKRKTEWFEWENDPNLKFEIGALSTDEKSLILQESDAVKQIRKGKIAGGKGYGKGLILRAIVNWKGMTVEHLAELTDPNKWHFKTGVEKGTPIPYSEEDKRYIASIFSGEFFGWVNDRVEDLDEELKKKRKAELKNSQSSSNIGKDTSH